MSHNIPSRIPSVLVAASFSIVAISGAPVSGAETQGEPSESFFEHTELSGFVDVYYGYNFNAPAASLTQLRTYDVEHNSFHVSLAELSLERKPTLDSRAGYRIDLDYGATAALVNAAEPGGDTFKNIGQAYVSYLAPAGKGLQIDFGKWNTPCGNEVVKSKDNWNYSRSLLFTLGEPTYHAGIRASYSFNDKFTLAAHVVNGWNNVRDNNSGKTFGLQATLQPSQSLTIVQLYMAGPEQTSDNGDRRQLADTVVSYAPTSRISIALNYDYGRDRVSGAAVRWQGIAGYFRCQPTESFGFASRLEYYDDHDGFTTGTIQNVKEITLTGEWKTKDGLLARLEYRRDVSDAAFFLKGDSEQVKNQDTLTLGVVYAFSSKKR